MKFSRLLFVPVCVALVFSACSSKKDGVMPETALAADSQVVMIFDGNHDGDFGKLMDLVDSFPKMDKKGVVEGLWNKEAQLPDYVKFVAPVFKKDFRVAVGVNDAAVSTAVVDVAAYFENADGFESLLKELLKANDVKVSEKKVDGKVFWTVEGEAVFIVREGNVFLFGKSDEELKGMLGNLEKKSGFVSVEGDYLAYVNVNGGLISEVLGGAYGEGVGNFGSSEVFVRADKNGVSFDSSMDLPGDDKLEAFKKVFGDVNYRLGLMNEVRVENPIAFAEYPSLKQYVDVIGYSVLREMGKIDPTANPVPQDLDVSGILAEKLGMDAGSLAEFVDSPFAFVMGDSEMLYPTMAFYMDMDKGDLEVAKSLTVKMDAWMADLIKFYDQFAKEKGFGEGALKREVVGMSGIPLHKLYLDFDALPEDILAAAVFVPGLDLETLKMELYYGLTSEDHFVIAFYPDFAESYLNGPVVGDDALVKAALKGFDIKNAYMASVVLPGRFVTIVDRWVELAKGGGFLNEDDAAQYDFYAHKFMGMLKSMVSVGSLDAGKVKSDGRLEIGN